MENKNINTFPIQSNKSRSTLAPTIYKHLIVSTGGINALSTRNPNESRSALTSAVSKNFSISTICANACSIDPNKSSYALTSTICKYLVISTIWIHTCPIRCLFKSRSALTPAICKYLIISAWTNWKANILNVSLMARNTNTNSLIIKVCIWTTNPVAYSTYINKS